MKVTTKKLSDTKVEVTVTLDQKDLQIAEEQAILRLSKEIKVQGFRPGKVPAEIAKKNINPNDLASTTADIAVRRTVPQAFEEAKNIPLIIPSNTFQVKPSNTKLWLTSSQKLNSATTRISK